MHNIHLRPHEDQERQLIQEVISVFLPQSCWEAERGYGGMNNTTYMLKRDDERYVLRVYETHTDLVKIAFEHHVLSALRESDFGLMVPAPVKAIKGMGIRFIPYTIRGMDRTKSQLSLRLVRARTRCGIRQSS